MRDPYKRRHSIVVVEMEHFGEDDDLTRLVVDLLTPKSQHRSIAAHRAQVYATADRFFDLPELPARDETVA